MGRHLPHLNEFFEQLDSNGYAPSLFTHDEFACDICKKNGNLQRHEIFHGSVRRDRSKRYGCWLYICDDCHNAIHFGEPQKYDWLKTAAQLTAMHHYEWSKEEFITIFGKNYLEE